MSNESQHIPVKEENSKEQKINVSRRAFAGSLAAAAVLTAGAIAAREPLEKAFDIFGPSQKISEDVEDEPHYQIIVDDGDTAIGLGQKYGKKGHVEELQAYIYEHGYGEDGVLNDPIIGLPEDLVDPSKIKNADPDYLNGGRE